MFFIDGPGGSGKTDLIQIIIDVIERQGKKVLFVASGIASLCLRKGKTAHSAFKILLKVTRTANISPNSSIARSLQQTALIVLYEAPM